MAVITESVIRELIKKEVPKFFKLTKKDILTPSARQYLSEKNIVIETEEMEKKRIEKEEKKDIQEKTQIESKTVEHPTYKYVCHQTGAHFMEKPEYMTQISGNQLVVKNHKRIILRGKIDSFLAKIIFEMNYLKKAEKDVVAKDLREIFNYVKQIQRAEILDEPLASFQFLGMNEAEQRAVSHNPKKHFGVDHLFMIDEETDEIAIRLNLLRTEARELEIKTVEAYYNGRSLEREDVAKAMNRMSSCIYIMMLKAVASKY